MHFPGISSYPVRWQHLIRAVALLVLMIVLEGIGTLVWLLAHPSEPGSRVFLAYSLERWILILAIAAINFALLFALWAIRSKSGRVEILLEFFERPKHSKNLLLSITILLLIMAGLMIWLSQSETIRPYYVRVFPLFLWGMAIVVQTWLFLMVQMRQQVVQGLMNFFPVDNHEEIYSIKTANKNLFVALIIISLLYLALQIRSYLAVREAILIGDSWSYLQGASLDLTDPNFFSERRPWAILLFFKLLGSSQPVIGIFQLSISTVSWLFLSWKFVGSIKNNWVKFSGFLVILGFSLTPAVQVWNYAVLSESLSISVMVLIIALFIGLAQKWEWRALFLLMLYFVLWMSFREANAYIALMIAFVLLAIGFMHRKLRVYWLLSFLIGVTFLINYQLSAAYALPRWALPLAEVITKRILPHQEYLNFFANNGMPVTPELMAFSGRWANSDGFAIVNSVELAKFEKWLYSDGRNVYVKFLLAHPGYVIESPLEDIKVLLAGDFFAGIPIPKYSPALPKVVNEAFYPEQWFWLYLWLSLFASGFIFAVSLRAKKKIYPVVFIFTLLAIPHLYLVWHGDALDVARHAVMGNVQFHLGIWLLIILFIDEVVTKPVPAAFANS